MKYEDILTFQQKVQINRPTSEAEINAMLLEEIAALRSFIEWYIPKPASTSFAWHDLKINNAA